MVTVHIPPWEKCCGRSPLVSPLTGSERLRPMSDRQFTVYSGFHTDQPGLTSPRSSLVKQLSRGGYAHDIASGDVEQSV